MIILQLREKSRTSWKQTSKKKNHSLLPVYSAQTLFLLISYFRPANPFQPKTDLGNKSDGFQSDRATGKILSRMEPLEKVKTHPLTSHLQMHDGLFVVFVLPEKASVLPIIRGFDLLEPHSDAALGDVVLHQRHSSPVLSHLLSLLLSPFSAHEHRGRDLLPEPAQLHALGAHVGGEATGQLCIFTHHRQDGFRGSDHVKASCRNTKRVGGNVEVGVEDWYRQGYQGRALSHYSSRESIRALGEAAKDNQMGLLTITEKFQACRLEIIL